MSDHALHEKRSLALHRIAAEKMRRDPALFEQAKLRLIRWRQNASLAATPCLDEWLGLMERGIEVCLAKAVEESEHASALRQSSPLGFVLSHQERFAFLKAFA